MKRKKRGKKKKKYENLGLGNLARSSCWLRLKGKHQHFLKNRVLKP
jgi:hypothetical protein